MRERTGVVAAGALVGYLLYGAAATVLFVYWNFPFDRLEQWGVAKIAQTAINKVKNNDVVLLHDIHATSVAAVPEILRTLTARGYHFVTLPGQRGHQRVPHHFLVVDDKNS